jgi:assimilatory nitrate reductase catalytic subunit
MPAATATHCPYCALQCAMTLDPASAAAVEQGFPEVAGRDFPTSRGGMCRKGWTSAELLASPSRLTAPLLRGADGAFREVSWDAALDRMAGEFRAARDRYGADGVGVFGGGSLTNEKAYQLGKFARIALRTSRIDYNGRFCMSSAAAAANRSLGLDRGLPFPVTDLDDARTVLLLGTNPAETMPPFVQHLEHAREHGGLVVVDPRRSATARMADDGGGVHLQPTPGTDLVLLLGLAHVVVHDGLADRDYLERRTTASTRCCRSSTPGGPSASSRSPVSPPRGSGAPRTCWPATGGAPTSSPAAAWSSTSTGRTPRPRPSTWPCSWACPASPAPAAGR